MVSETDCSNCEAVHFDKSKWSLKSGLDKQKDLSEIAIGKILKMQNTVEKQITTLASIIRKLLIG